MKIPNRIYGDDFAEDITEEINNDINTELVLTKNSGATHRDGDAYDDSIIIDFKASQREVPPKSVPVKEVMKVTKQASDYMKLGILISEAEETNIVSMTLDTFKSIYDIYNRCINDKDKREDKNK